MKHFAAALCETTRYNQPLSKSCEKIMDLGYIEGKRVNLYGGHFEIASDPFIDGDWVAVRRLAKTILLYVQFGSRYRFL